MKEKNRFVKFLPLVAGLVIFLVFGNVALAIESVEVYNPSSLHVRDTPADYKTGGKFDWARIVSIPFYTKDIIVPVQPRYPGDPGGEKRYWFPEPSVIIPASPSLGTVNRRIFPSIVSPGGTLTITLTPSPTCLFDRYYYVNEGIPAGFSYLNTTAHNATVVDTVNGKVVHLVQNGGSSITYMLKAPQLQGTYTIEKGSFSDERMDFGGVSGTKSITVESGYYANVIREVDISKVFLAVMDNFNGLIGKQETFCKGRKIFYS